MKKSVFIGLIGCVTILFNSCIDWGHIPPIPPEDTSGVTIERVTNHVKISASCEVGVDSLLPQNKSVFWVWTMVSDTDSIFQFRHSVLHAPNQPINVQFIPCTAFDKYKSDIKDTFVVTPNIVNWIQPMEYVSNDHPFIDKYDVSLQIFAELEQNGKSKDWKIIAERCSPERKYFYYDWESKAHYDYMRYNADSAVVTFLIANNLVVDTITPLDSAWICLSTTPVKRVYTQFPMEIKDTISIVRDTTYQFSLGGYMKGQKCATNTYSLRVHKNEIISDQDQTYRNQGNIYEYTDNILYEKLLDTSTGPSTVRLHD